MKSLVAVYRAQKGGNILSIESSEHSTKKSFITELKGNGFIVLAVFTLEQVQAIAATPAHELATLTPAQDYIYWVMANASEEEKNYFESAAYEEVLEEAAAVIESTKEENIEAILELLGYQPEQFEAGTPVFVELNNITIEGRVLRQEGSQVYIQRFNSSEISKFHADQVERCLKFSELTPAAQQYALDEYREDVRSFFYLEPNDQFYNISDDELRFTLEDEYILFYPIGAVVGGWN